MRLSQHMRQTKAVVFVQLLFVQHLLPRLFFVNVSIKRLKLI